MSVDGLFVVFLFVLPTSLFFSSVSSRPDFLLLQRVIQLVDKEFVDFDGGRDLSELRRGSFRFRSSLDLGRVVVVRCLVAFHLLWGEKIGVDDGGRREEEGEKEGREGREE